MHGQQQMKFETVRIRVAESGVKYPTTTPPFPNISTPTH